MTDREKVIVGLTDSIEILSDFDTQEYTIRERQQLHGSVIAAIQDALALLKAQEPLKPVRDTSYGARPWWFVCGNCKLSVNEDQKYCPNCGRGVKWE